MTSLKQSLSLQIQLDKKTQDWPSRRAHGWRMDRMTWWVSPAPDVCNSVIEGPAIWCLAATQELRSTNLQLQAINMHNLVRIAKKIWRSDSVISPASMRFRE